MATTTITVRMDENLKRQAEHLFDDLGMNMTTAITVFMKAAVREHGMPFDVKVDPFWSEENQRRLVGSIARYEAGAAAYVEKSMRELEGMEDG